MANYAVRIYDSVLRAWLIAEAARRGRGIKTSDIVEAALRCYQAHIVDEGSFDATAEVSSASRDAVRGGDASDRAPALADAVSGEAVVQPVPAVDPERPMDAVINEMNELTKRVLDRAAVEDAARPMDPNAKFQPNLMYAPVPRMKGPDSGPDDELGF